MQEIDASPLHTLRNGNKKIVGTCRDFAILLTSMCISVGIAARMRVGFATYTYKDIDIFVRQTNYKVKAEQINIIEKSKKNN